MGIEDRLVGFGAFLKSSINSFVAVHVLLNVDILLEWEDGFSVDILSVCWAKRADRDTFGVELSFNKFLSDERSVDLCDESLPNDSWESLGSSGGMDDLLGAFPLGLSLLGDFKPFLLLGFSRFDFSGLDFCTLPLSIISCSLLFGLLFGSHTPGGSTEWLLTFLVNDVMLSSKLLCSETAAINCSGVIETVFPSSNSSLIPWSVP
jgi:hypothetical protein